MEIFQLYVKLPCLFQSLVSIPLGEHKYVRICAKLGNIAQTLNGYKLSNRIILMVNIGNKSSWTCKTSDHINLSQRLINELKNESLISLQYQENKKGTKHQRSDVIMVRLFN